MSTTENWTIPIDISLDTVLGPVQQTIDSAILSQKLSNRLLSIAAISLRRLLAHWSLRYRSRFLNGLA